MRWEGQVAHMGKRRMPIGLWLEREGKRVLGRPRHKWEDNIKLDLENIGWDVMGWIALAQDRDQWRAVVNTVMNLRVPQNVGKFLSSCTTGGFPRSVQFHGVSYV
jgi:hypothetical protein